jgi:hypothetical protein
VRFPFRSRTVSFRARACRLVTLFGIPLALAGCGYTQVEYSGESSVAADGTTVSKSRSLYRGDVRTVAVPIFTNRTFERNIEFELSKAIVNYIESNTPYKVVPKERADTILEGEITDYRIRTTSNSQFTGIPQEQLATIRCNFTWKDMRNGRILTERKHFDQSGSYYPTLGEGRFIGDEAQVEKLAVAIVQELQADW